MEAQIRKQKNNGQEERKWKTRKMRKNHTPLQESMYEKRLNLQQRTFTTLKALAFLSRQMHQIKQWGTNLQTSMWRCHANFPYQALNNSRTVWGITQWMPNKQKTKDHNSQAMEQWSRRWSTDSHTSYTYNASQVLSLFFYEGCLLLRSYLRRQTKKRKPPLEEPSIAISFSMGRKQE